MHGFKRYLGGTTLALTLTLTGAAHGDEANQKYRQSVMKAVGAHTSALGQIAKDEVKHFSHMSAHAEALVALSTQVPDAFRAEGGDDKSRAKAEIWSDWTDFEAKNKDFQDAAMKVAAAAKSGHAGDVGGTLKALFDSCKGCHKAYRKPKDD